VYSTDDWVLMTGHGVDAPGPESEGVVNRIGLYWKPWFYTHVQEFLELASDKKKDDAVTRVEFIPLRDYYHRHTRSLFWEIKDIVPFGNDVWFRYVVHNTLLIVHCRCFMYVFFFAFSVVGGGGE
jgi:delta24-sterol reductase